MRLCVPWSTHALPCPALSLSLAITPHPRSAYGLGPLLEEEVERETAHQRIRLGDGVEFRIGEGGDGLMARGALPKGTTRK